MIAFVGPPTSRGKWACPVVTIFDTRLWLFNGSAGYTAWHEDSGVGALFVCPRHGRVGPVDRCPTAIPESHPAMLAASTEGEAPRAQQPKL